MLRSIRFAVLLLLLVVAPALSMAAGVDEPMRLPVDPAPLVFETGHGTKSLAVEIADTADKRERGLMFRKDFPADRAMLFVFPMTQPVMMWMKNTPLSLDMIFVGPAGRIVSIRKNTTPFSTDIIPSGGMVRFAIEVDAGVATRLGLEKGDRVRHPVIDRIAKEQ